MKNLKKRGFTLVEIMIVVAIIALLSAIAIPNLLRARVNANEAAAIGAVRTISTACESYRSAQTPITYPDSTGDAGLIQLGTGSNPPYIDARYADGVNQGYNFTYVFTNANQYTLTADPVNDNVTGVRGFFVDQTGVIRVDGAGAATVASNPLE